MRTSKETNISSSSIAIDPADDGPLVDRVRRIWKRDLNVLPVSKDLPRLVGGLQIVDSTSNIVLFKEEDSMSRAVACREILVSLATIVPDMTDEEISLQRRKQKKQQRQQRKKKVQDRRKSSFDTHSERDIADDDDNDELDAADDALNTSEGDSTASTPTMSSRSVSSLRFDSEFENDILFDDDSDQEDSSPLTSPIGSAPSLKDSQSLIRPSSDKLEKRRRSKSKESTSNLFVSLLKTAFSKYVKEEGGDLGAHMNAFFQSGVINPEARMAKILKCIQQEIICPAVMDLRYSFYQTFPYKDVKGTWNIKIEFQLEPPLDNLFSSDTSGSPQESVMTVVDEQIEQKSPMDKPTLKRAGSVVLQRDKRRESLIDLHSPKKRSNSRPILVPPLDCSVSFDSLSHLSSRKLSRTISTTSLLNFSSNLQSRKLKDIRVIHRKREQSHDDDPSLYFDFEWELTMTFDAEMKDITTASFQVIDLNTTPSILKERKEELLRSLRSFASEEFPYKMIMKGPCRRIYKELPTILSTLEVINKSGRMLYSPNQNSIYNLLVVLSEYFNDTESISRSLSSKPIEYYHGRLDPKIIKTLLSNIDMVFPRIGLIIKSLSKELLVPAAAKIRDLLSSEIKEIKDVKGTWKILMELGLNSIVVHHELRSACSFANLKSELDLVWGIDCVFSISNVDLLESKVKILEYSFKGDVPLERKTQILEVLSSLKTADTMESSAVSIPVPSILQSVIDAVSSLPEDKLLVKHPLIPDSVTIRTLLDLLNAKLSQEDIGPIIVQIRK